MAGLAVAVAVAALVALAVRSLVGPGAETVTIPVPGAPSAVAATGDVVWVSAAGAQAVWPIDAASGRQAGPGIRTGGAPSRLAVGAAGLWIADSVRGSVIPVDTQARQVFPAVEVGADVTDVALGAGAVWVASSAEGLVRAIEPDGRVRRLAVGGEPVDVAAADRWVVAVDGANGTVARIDGGARRMIGEPVDVGGVPVAVAVSGDTAWVANSAHGTVVAVDLVGGRAGTTVDVGGKPFAVAADGQDVWALTDRTLVRVDGRDGEVLSRRELEEQPTALALDDRYVWVAAGAEREVLRIER